jgi:hypothetical protein
MKRARVRATMLARVVLVTFLSLAALSIVDGPFALAPDAAATPACPPGTMPVGPTCVIKPPVPRCHFDPIDGIMYCEF